MSTLSIVVIDWCKVDVREKYDDNLVLLIQMMRDVNFLMIAKTKNELKLKKLISKLKDEYWDNTESKKSNNKGQGGWKRCYNGKHFSTKLILILKNNLWVRYVILLWK